MIWDRQAEGLGGLEVDHQLELRGLLYGEIGRLRPFQDLVHVGGGAMSPTRRTSRRVSERASARAAYGTVMVVPSPLALMENVPAAAFGVYV
jgi:hypothetical protein